MTRLDQIRARLAAATPHVIGKPTITELEDLLDHPDTKVDIAPSGEVTVCTPLLIAPADLRLLLELADKVSVLFPRREIIEAWWPVHMDKPVEDVRGIVAQLDSPVGDEGAK